MERNAHYRIKPVRIFLFGIFEYELHYVIPLQSTRGLHRHPNMSHEFSQYPNYIRGTSLTLFAKPLLRDGQKKKYVFF